MADEIFFKKMGFHPLLRSLLIRQPYTVRFCIQLKEIGGAAVKRPLRRSLSFYSGQEEAKIVLSLACFGRQAAQSLNSPRAQEVFHDLVVVGSSVGLQSFGRLEKSAQQCRIPAVGHELSRHDNLMLHHISKG